MPEILMISECLNCKKVYAERMVNITENHVAYGKNKMVSHGYCKSCAAPKPNKEAIERINNLKFEEIEHVGSI